MKNNRKCCRGRALGTGAGLVQVRMSWACCSTSMAMFFTSPHQKSKRSFMPLICRKHRAEAGGSFQSSDLSTRLVSYLIHGALRGADWPAAGPALGAAPRSSAPSDPPHRCCPWSAPQTGPSSPAAPPAGHPQKWIKGLRRYSHQTGPC